MYKASFILRFLLPSYFNLDINYSAGVSASNVAVIVISSVTVSGNSHQELNTYHSSAVAVTSTLSSHVQIVNTLSSALIGVQ
jgi:hypothetical protein